VRQDGKYHINKPLREKINHPNLTHLSNKKVTTNKFFIKKCVFDKVSYLIKTISEFFSVLIDFYFF